jgi:hypothetical protein
MIYNVLFYIFIVFSLLQIVRFYKIKNESVEGDIDMITDYIREKKYKLELVMIASYSKMLFISIKSKRLASNLARMYKIRYLDENDHRQEQYIIFDPIQGNGKLEIM